MFYKYQKEIEGNLPGPLPPGFSPSKRELMTLPSSLSPPETLQQGPRLDLTANMWKLMPKLGMAQLGTRGSSS